MSLKEKLIEIGLCIDNEYLDKYVELIESNRNTKREKFKTQRHHIIPRYYYKKNNLEVDNSKENCVHLLYKNHFIAHLLLSLCSSTEEFFYNSFISLSYMNKHFSYVDLDILQTEYEKCRQRCALNNPMYNKEYKEIHAISMRSEKVRTKISETMKKKRERGELFSAKIRKKISESQKTLIYVYKDDAVIRVKPENLSKYLNNGWTRYVKRSYEQLCGHEMMTVNEVQRNRFNTRGVGCYCVLDTGERFEFKSIRDATVWWFENYHPFGEKYSEVTLQRKIKSSIQGKDITYLPRCASTRKHVKEDNNVKIITNIKWYK